MAELPLTVQLVSVVVPPALSSPPPLPVAELPLMVQSVSVVVPPRSCTSRRRVGGGVAADGAVGQRASCRVVVQPAAVPGGRAARDGQAAEVDAVTPLSTWNTRLRPPPLTVTPAAGPVIVSVPLVLLSSSWPAST